MYIQVVCVSISNLVSTTTARLELVLNVATCVILLELPVPTNINEALLSAEQWKTSNHGRQKPSS